MLALVGLCQARQTFPGGGLGGVRAEGGVTLPGTGDGDGSGRGDGAENAAMV